MTKKTAKEEKEAQWKALLNEADRRRDESVAVWNRVKKDPEAAEGLKREMIADLVRVSQVERPIVGPSSSRARYREIGHYSSALVPHLFGNHAEFQRAAGLRDPRTTTRGDSRSALLHTHQKVADYAEKELRPFDGAFDRTKGRGSLSVLVGSDFHSQFVSRFALRVFLEAAEWMQPDVVVLNGDIVDFPSVSRHRKLPGHFRFSLQDEIDFVRQHLFAELRRRCPRATIKFVIGNHEYRLVNAIADDASYLSTLRTLRFADLFGLADYEIGLVCRSTFLAPYAAQRKLDRTDNYEVIADAYVVTHGTALGKTASVEQLARYQKSGTSGHTHRPQLFCANALGTGPLSWMSTPMMASHAVGRDYVAEPDNWQMGFGLARIHRGEVSQQIVTVHRTWAELASKVWEADAAEIAADDEAGRV